MSHNHDQNNNDGSIKFGLVLNTGFTIVEFVFGILTGSLALIADAAHNLTDTFTLSVSFAANRLAKREANDSKTFGYGRATILAALLNASVMLAVAAFIVIEAIQRFGDPHPVEGGVVAVVQLDDRAVAARVGELPQQCASRADGRGGLRDLQAGRLDLSAVGGARPGRGDVRPGADRKSTRLNSSHEVPSRMPSSA